MVVFMNLILKNFLSVVRRYKLAVVLNILGLSVAFAAFMIIMIQLDYDVGFDKFHKDYDKIFRVEYVRNASPQTNMNCPIAYRLIDSSPNILAGGIAHMRLAKTRFYLQGDDVRNMFEENSWTVTATFF
jgi:putative ABC transport system permease protein